MRLQWRNLSFDLPLPTLFRRLLPLPTPTGGLGALGSRLTLLVSGGADPTPFACFDYLIWSFLFLYLGCCPGICVGIGGSCRRVSASSKSRSLFATLSTACAAFWVSVVRTSFSFLASLAAFTSLYNRGMMFSQSSTATAPFLSHQSSQIAATSI